jgi:hypothetical protein
VEVSRRGGIASANATPARTYFNLDWKRDDVTELKPDGMIHS